LTLAPIFRHCEGRLTIVFVYVKKNLPPVLFRFTAVQSLQSRIYNLVAALFVGYILLPNKEMPSIGKQTIWL
jgi:hypothetical protein